MPYCFGDIGMQNVFITYETHSILLLRMKIDFVLENFNSAVPDQIVPVFPSLQGSI